MNRQISYLILTRHSSDELERKLLPLKGITARNWLTLEDLTRAALLTNGLLLSAILAAGMAYCQGVAWRQWNEKISRLRSTTMFSRWCLGLVAGCRKIKNRKGPPALHLNRQAESFELKVNSRSWINYCHTWHVVILTRHSSDEFERKLLPLKGITARNWLTLEDLTHAALLTNGFLLSAIFPSCFLTDKHKALKQAQALSEASAKPSCVNKVESPLDGSSARLLYELTRDIQHRRFYFSKNMCNCVNHNVVLRSSNWTSFPRCPHTRNSSFQQWIQPTNYTQGQHRVIQFQI